MARRKRKIESGSALPIATMLESADSAVETACVQTCEAPENAELDSMPASSDQCAVSDSARGDIAFAHDSLCGGESTDGDRLKDECDKADTSVGVESSNGNHLRERSMTERSADDIGSKGICKGATRRRERITVKPVQRPAQIGSIFLSDLSI